MEWIVGVDGGGSKTTACAADMSGNVIGRVDKGPANYHTTGLPAFQALIGGIIDTFCRDHGLAQNELRLVSLGLAGVDRERDREQILGALTRLGLPCRFLINNDAVIALTAGLGRTEGIVLIAGTGSIAYGVTPEGRGLRAGGWGHIVGDEGSGYDIGRQALQRAIRAREDRDRATVLLDRIMTRLQFSDFDDLIGFVYRPESGKAAIAALAEVVAAAAGEGDAVAAEILSGAAIALAELVASVIARGFPSGQIVPVCTYGGVINNVAPVRRQVAAILTGKARLIRPEKEPVSGALQMGYDYLKGLET